MPERDHSFFQLVLTEAQNIAGSFFAFFLICISFAQTSFAQTSFAQSSETFSVPISTFTISNARTVTEGDTLVFQVTGENRSRENIVLSVSGRAGSGQPRFRLINQSLTARPGQFSRSVRVQTFDVERAPRSAARTVIVSLSTRSKNVSFERSSATGNIRDKGEPARFSIAPERTNEGGVLTFKIKMSGFASSSDRFFVLTRDGSARAGNDYRALPRTPIRFRSGQTITQSIQTIDNDRVDGDRSFMFAVVNRSGRLQARTSGTIRNNDRPAPPPSFSINPAPAVTEGGTLRFPVRGTNTTNQVITLRVRTTGSPSGTAAFFQAPRILNIPAGRRAPPVVVRTTEDPAENGMRAVRATISSPDNRSTIGQASAVGRVTDKPVPVVDPPDPDPPGSNPPVSDPPSTDPPPNNDPDVPPTEDPIAPVEPPIFALIDAEPVEEGRQLRFIVEGTNTGDNPVILAFSASGGLGQETFEDKITTVQPGETVRPIMVQTSCSGGEIEARNIVVTLRSPDQSAQFERSRAIGVVNRSLDCTEEPLPPSPPTPLPPAESTSIWPIVLAVAAGIGAATGAGWLLVPKPGLSMAMNTGSSSFEADDANPFAMPAIKTRIAKRLGESELPSPLPIQSPENDI